MGEVKSTKDLHGYLSDTGSAKDFDQKPFNEIDGMVLAQVSNLKLDSLGLNLGSGKSMTIKQAYDQLKDTSVFRNMNSNDVEFFDEIANNNRYANLELSNFVHDPIKNEVGNDVFTSVGADSIKEQFAAVTIKYKQNGKTYNYVSYRATDTSLDGWGEDMLDYCKMKTQAQRDSIDYMNYVAKHTDGVIVGGGHSKGANNFECAYLFCDEEAKKRIEKGYVYDGPGLLKEVLKKTDRYDDYKRITNNTFVCPEESIIGQLMTEADNAKFVKSKEKDGLNAHDMFSWVLEKDEKTGEWGLVYGEQSEMSKTINKITDELTDQFTPEEREVLVDAFLYILYSCGGEDMNKVIDRIGKKVTKNGKLDKIALAKTLYDELFANGMWDHLTLRQKVLMINIIGKTAGYAIVEFVWPKIKKKSPEPLKKIEEFLEKTLRNIYKEYEEIGGPYVDKAKRFFKGVIKKVRNTIKKVLKPIADKFNKGLKYSKSHTQIYVDTNELVEYASRLSKIHGRLEDADAELGKLYKKLSPVNQQRLQMADKEIGTSSLIAKSINYLRTTAGLFAEADAKIKASLK